MAATRILALLAALVALGFYFGPHRELEQDETRLGEVAATIAGRNVEIACPGALATLTEVSARDGSVVFSNGEPADVARVSGDTCGALRSLLHGDVTGLDCLSRRSGCPREAREAAIAVNVLSHESWHLAGVRDEADAQCYALQTNAETAVRLGASPEDARSVAAYVLREVQPALPADYRTSRCRDGGPLDLHPHGQSWP